MTTRSTVRAVRTTGIYCRPECAARPHPDNVTEFPLAAAAEAAGYRPCHRCRPYRDHLDVGSIGSDLVCRGVRLITAGHLDDHDEADLAARLGISSRHLRRTFVEHLGVTPDALARSARTHFARRLLDDTDLAVNDVAFAAGFGSVRQLQRACVATFGAPPGELRARRRVTDRLVADGGLKLRLAFDGELDWSRTSSWFVQRAIEGVEIGPRSVHRYLRTIDVDGDPAMIELAEIPGEQALELTAHLPHWHGLAHLVARVRGMAGLDVNQPGAVAHLRDDPVLGPLVQANPGLRPPGCWSAFEVSVRAVIGQQVSVKAARTLGSRMCAAFGEPVEGLAPLGLDRLFPEPAALASADLTQIGLTGARARTISELARAFTDGTITLSVPAGPDDAHDDSSELGTALAALRTIKGIGEWTTQYVALRLGSPDAFPDGDVALREAWARLTGSQRPSAVELASIAERWHPWRSFAAMHLWASLSDSDRKVRVGDQKSRVK